MLLDVKDLRTYFNTEDGLIKAVDGVSFCVEAGRTVGIVGESGCGKSVTALSVMRLLATPPAEIQASSICFNNHEILGLTSEQMRELMGDDIAMIFQEPMTSLNPVYTVGDQVAESLVTHRSQMSKSDVRKKVVELFEWVGISDAASRFDQYPHELSGGMRQRVMIAMALACEPKLLIADEPTTALDVTIQAQILELIERLQKETGMAVILITHDLGVVAEMVDEVIVMYAGSVVERASVREIFKNPLHPYTKGLLDSIPSMQVSDHDLVDGKKMGRLKAIEGNVPNPLHLPKGCSFQDRCHLVTERCRKEDPILSSHGEEHEVSCFEV